MDNITILYGLIVIATWIYIVRAQRFKSLDRTRRDYSVAELTPLQAQKITHELSSFESPFLYSKSLEFALFKTYAIPSISRLLAKTNQLVGSNVYGKRVEDTGIILNAAATFELNSEMSTLAIARMNYIHAQYKSQITNEDLLYTLSLFIVEPVKWHAKFGWRPLHDVEVQANFLLWKAIGERMEIEDIPETYEGLTAWIKDYESDKMTFAASNKMVADSSIRLFMRPIPSFMHPLARNIIYALLEPQVLKAFDYEPQPRFIHMLIRVIFAVRNVLMLNFFLPATESAQRLAPEDVTEDGRYHARFWNFEPFYVKNSIMTRLRAKWIGLDDYEGPKADAKYFRHGFKLDDEVGPDNVFGKGGQHVRDAAQRMRGCPFR